jgi:hypothetical protein
MSLPALYIGLFEDYSKHEIEIFSIELVKQF